MADELLAVVGDGLRPGVVTAQLEALAEAAVDGRLESVVVRFAVHGVAWNGAQVVAAGASADQMGREEAGGAAVGAGRIEILRDRARRSVVSSWRPGRVGCHGVKVDAALVELVVRHVADVRDVHDEALAEILLDTEAPVVGGGGLQVARTPGGRLGRANSGPAPHARYA